MRWPQLSIRSTVLASIVIGVLLPALLVLTLDHHLTQRSQEPVVERSQSATMVMAAAMLTEPAWTLSEEGLDAAVAGILAQPSVCTVEVLDLQPATGPLRRGECAQGARVDVREAPVRYEGRTIARLRLGFDGREIDRVLAERRQVTGWLVAAQVLFGVAVLAGVLSLRLLRPIGALKQQAGGLAAREPLPPVDWPRDDELGQLGRHLNTVQGQIQGLIGELEAKNAQLQQLAMYDHLTGLPNRTLLREIFVHEAAQARRDGAQMALLFLDLDHFKSVNDDKGHACGDELLVTVGRRLSDALRDADVVCRMGGDEFLVLLPRVEHTERATALAQRLVQAVARPLLLQGVGEPLRVGASIGVAMYPADGGDFDALVRAADVAMYRSKDRGRGRWTLYQPEMDAVLQQRLALERELAAGIGGGQLRLMLQPVVDARDGRRIGAEALVRWMHPQRGLLAPDAFLPVAEASGLIQPLGHWVLDAACARLAGLQQGSPAEFQIGVNVSALQLHDPGFVALVQDTLQRYRIARGSLILELTESTLLADGDSVLRAVATLRESGVALAIDDFGTGYSSLSALKRVRPEHLKIDRSFVRDLPGSADDCALAEAIFGMAAALGIGVVAEGVETEAQRDWLLARGGWRQQGFLWARPMPAEAFEAVGLYVQTRPER